jgi:protein SCO1/2
LLLGAVVSLAAQAVGTAPPALKAGVFDPPRLAPDFSLQGSAGGELQLSRYRGKVVLLAFGFTSCPQVCPTTLAVLAQARKKLGAAGDGVQVVYVTVDPERDDAARMKKYLGTFDTNFIGCTGTPEQLARVREQYGVYAEKKSFGNDYSVAHSTSVFLIDRAGRIRALMPYGRSPDDYVHDLRILLAQ